MLLSSCFALAGCFDFGYALLAERYVKWMDTDNKIEFAILEEARIGYGTLYVNGIKRKALFEIETSTIHSLSITLIEEGVYEGEFLNETVPFTFNRTIIYSNSESLTLFGELYKQLTFNKSVVDKDQIDAADYLCITWSNYTDVLKVYFSQYSYLKATGNIKDKNGIWHVVLFMWKENRRFDICLYDDEIISAYPVVSGSYKNTETVLELTLEQNSLFDENTSEIKLFGKFR